MVYGQHEARAPSRTPVARFGEASKKERPLPQGPSKDLGQSANATLIVECGKYLVTITSGIGFWISKVPPPCRRAPLSHGNVLRLGRVDAALWWATRPTLRTSIGPAARSASDRHVGGGHSAYNSSRLGLIGPARKSLRNWLGNDVAFWPGESFSAMQRYVRS